MAVHSSGLEPLDVVRGEGWLIANYRLVQCTYYGPEVDQAGFEAHLEQLGREIDERDERERVGVFYYVPDTSGMDSPRRRALAKLLDARKDKLERTTLAYGLATRSPFVRGVLSTVFWLAPPPYPYKVSATALEALEFVAEHLVYLDARALHDSFMDLLEAQGVRSRQAG